MLPAEEGQPCTRAVCEIAHADDGGFHAEVEFVTRDEWGAEVRPLGSALAASLPVAGESDEDRKVSAAMTKAATRTRPLLDDRRVSPGAYEVFWEQ